MEMSKDYGSIKKDIKKDIKRNSSEKDTKRRSIDEFERRSRQKRFDESSKQWLEIMSNMDKYRRKFSGEFGKAGISVGEYDALKLQFNLMFGQNSSGSA